MADHEDKQPAVYVVFNTMMICYGSNFCILWDVKLVFMNRYKVASLGLRTHNLKVIRLKVAKLSTFVTV